MDHISYALNFCGCHFRHRDLPDTLASEAARHGIDRFGRIYLGSYCCENDFLSMSASEANSLKAHCLGRRLAATVVLPVPAESRRADVYRGLDRLLDLLGPVADEICANDIGSLLHCAGLPRMRLVAGRLFFKHQRDPRVSAARLPVSISAASLDLAEEMRLLSGIELDCTFSSLSVDRTVPGSCLIGIHAPSIQVSRMRVCQFAGSTSAGSIFAPGAPCGFECRGYSMEYRTRDGALFRKTGKAVMADCPLPLPEIARLAPRTHPLRLIVQPEPDGKDAS